MVRVDRFMMRKQKAQAFGRERRDNRFLVEKGSTAIREGSPKKKRDKELRDYLIVTSVLVQDRDPDLLRFACDYEFSSCSRASGVIIDGNCSGPEKWFRLGDWKSLKEIRESRKT